MEARNKQQATTKPGIIMTSMISSTSETTVEVLPEIDFLNIVGSKIDIDAEREDIDDAFYVCDLGDVVSKYQSWKRQLPNIHPYFAVKCNTDPVMLKILIAMGVGFDCASKGEIGQLLELGAKPENIVYAHPCKQPSHICYARDKGVAMTVFDNENELIKIKKFHPTSKLFLRIATDDSASVSKLSVKFGAELKSCRRLIDAAYEMKLDVIGISFHVGSKCGDANAFVRPFKEARMLFDYAQTVGYQFSCLDVGGGFPGNDPSKFEEISIVLNRCIDKFFPRDTFKHVRVIAEPGRYFVASAFMLATNVIAKREISQAPSHITTNDSHLPPQALGKPEFMYYINDGHYGSLKGCFLDAAMVTMSLLKVVKPAQSHAVEYSSSIWGQTHYGHDRVIEQVLLPEIDIDDWIVWHDLGDYSISIADSPLRGYRPHTIYHVILDRKFAEFKNMSSDVEVADVIFKPKLVIDLASDLSGTKKESICTKSALVFN